MPTVQYCSAHEEGLWPCLCIEKKGRHSVATAVGEPENAMKRREALLSKEEL